MDALALKLRTNQKYRKLYYATLYFLLVVFIGITIYETYFDLFISDVILGRKKLGWKAFINGETFAKVLQNQNVFYIWIGACVFAFTIRLIVIIDGYRKSIIKFGKENFHVNIITFYSTRIVSTITRVLFFSFLGLVVSSSGINYLFKQDFLSVAGERLTQYVSNNFPTLFNVSNYWIALFLTIIFIGLPGYIIHYLCHKYRLMWLLFHKPHHAPTILNPLAMPPTVIFEFLLLLPAALIGVFVSKLFYTEPLIVETSIWIIAGYGLEVLNHSEVHYEFAYKNFFIRNLCRLFGDKGVYHMMHHSSHESDLNINLSEGPFHIWDRIFGTYKKPYPTPSKAGLHKNPQIQLNPLKIIYSGLLQILFELEHNKGFKTKLKILFGTVYYTPPITKDFLIKEKSN